MLRTRSCSKRGVDRIVMSQLKPTFLAEEVPEEALPSFGGELHLPDKRPEATD